MLNQIITTPHEVDLVVIILFLFIIAIAIGKNGSKALFELLRKLLWREQEVNINLERGDMPTSKGAIFCDPDKCTPMAQVKQQQQQNMKDIVGLANELHGLTDLFFKKLNFIKSQNEVMLRALVKNNQISESDIPKEIP